ncbi:LacI family transcriptional regulator [Opitutaceae bacterium TAV4]|nr:LacI family transcriptional regulator [Opitutaceae bacterium TAV4]RRK02803.1 LacI family transcriptional regulator [Opitutaceae bacterium TAV3]
MAVSQKQIADSLNLSIITVSRALRNHPYLSDETRSRVLQKARELGYTKGGARQTTEKRGGAVRRAGVIFFENPEQKENPFAAGVKGAIFHALQKECQRMHVETIIETTPMGEAPMLVRNRTVDVTFVFGRYTPETVEHLRDVPTLAVSSFIATPGLPRIVADNLRGMQEATEHLIGLGHRKILFLGLDSPHTRLYRERAEGYQLAMSAHDLESVVQLVPAMTVPVKGYRDFTGIVCASDSLAYSLQGQLGMAGRRVPEDCSIVGFDNLSGDYPHFTRKITTYAPDWELMGRMAAGLMLSSPLDIRNQNLVVTVPGKLLVHESTAAPVLKG